MRRLVILSTALLFTGLLGFASGQGESAQEELTAEPDAVVQIEGMTCDLCAIAIRKSLLEVEGIQEAVVSLEDNAAYLIMTPEVTDETIEEAVRRAGEYRATGFERLKGTGGES